jgi:DME family drug/metabolite transporter
MIGELAALGAAISWTVSALLYGKALQEAKPLSANIIRLTATSAFLIALLAVLGKFSVLASLETDTLILAGVSGIIGLGIGDTLYMVSLKSIGVSRAVPITCTYPLFTIVWAIFLVGEPVTLSIVFGAVAIVFGIWLLSREKNRANRGAEKKILSKSVAIALTTAIIWSIGITMVNIAMKEAPDLDHAYTLNILRVIAAAALMTAASPIIDRTPGFTRIGKKNVIAIIIGGIVALGFGWFLLTYSFIHTLEAQAVPISSTTPLFSTFLGAALLHEKLTAKGALGAIIIVFGVFLIFLV